MKNDTRKAKINKRPDTKHIFRSKDLCGVDSSLKNWLLNTLCAFLSSTSLPSFPAINKLTFLALIHEISIQLADHSIAFKQYTRRRLSSSKTISGICFKSMFSRYFGQASQGISFTNSQPASKTLSKSAADKSRSEKTLQGIILMGTKNYSFQAYFFFLIGINVTWQAFFTMSPIQGLQ